MIIMYFFNKSDFFTVAIDLRDWYVVPNGMVLIFVDQIAKSIRRSNGSQLSRSYWAESTGYTSSFPLLKDKKVEETFLSAGATAAAYAAAAAAPAPTTSDASHSPAPPAWASMETPGGVVVCGN